MALLTFTLDNVIVQAEAALELQRLRARLLDGLCPAKLRQSERVKRLAKRLARLEQNVGRVSAFGKVSLPMFALSGSIFVT